MKILRQYIMTNLYLKIPTELTFFNSIPRFDILLAFGLLNNTKIAR